MDHLSGSESSGVEMRLGGLGANRALIEINGGQCVGCAG